MIRFRNNALRRAAALPLLALLALAGPAAADAPAFGNDYWASVDASDRVALRDSVHELLRTTHNRVSFPSGANWPILEAADQNPSAPGEILDIYANDSIPIGTPRMYDREHVWPRSLGFPDGGDWTLNPLSDLHNLYLCDPFYNSSRSNYHFDFIPDSTDEFPTQFNNGAGGGSGVYPGNSNWRDNAGRRWEVWVDRRGDAARCILYMAVRYQGGTGPDGSLEPDLRLTNNPSLIQTGAAPVAYMGLSSVVLAWHAEDPPDQKERDRHDIVAAAQQNRNPFIDYPEWARCIFLDDCGGVAPIHPQGLFAVAEDGTVILQWDARVESDLAGYHVYRSSEGGPFDPLTATLVTGTLFADPDPLIGIPATYAVTAVDLDGNESLLSQPASATAGDRVLIAQQTFDTTSGWSIDGGTADEGNAFFGRWTLNPDTVPSQLQTAIAGVVGNGFIAGANTNGTPTQQSQPGWPLPPSGIHTLSLDPISVEDFRALSIEIALNAREADVYDSIGTSGEDYLRVFAVLDGGPPILVGQFTKMAPAGFNGRLGLDINLDGVGDIEIQDYSRLEDYAFTVPGTEGDDPASTLVVQIVTRFDANGEEIVYDNIRVTGVERATRVGSWDELRY